MFRKIYLCLLLLIPLSSAAAQGISPEQEKQVKQHIATGYKELMKNNYEAAAKSFTSAADIARILRVRELKVFLPAAPSGWQIIDEETSDESAAAASSMLSGMMGGMSVVSRKYKSAASEVEVSLVTDSPLIDMMVSMAKLSPAAATQGKEIYKGAIVEFEKKPDENELSLISLDGFAINISGQGLTKDQAMIFASGINFDALKAELK